jgi:Arc/MetJ-type ribon-helix-helix transcriptional regulator
MKRLTISVTERQYYRIRARVRSGEASSKSDAVRQILDGHEDVHNRCEELQRRCEDLKDGVEAAEAKRDELRRQLQARDTEETAPVEASNDGVGELVELIEEERRAGVLRRVKWWLFGR